MEWNIFFRIVIGLLLQKNGSMMRTNKNTHLQNQNQHQFRYTHWPPAINSLINYECVCENSCCNYSGNHYIDKFYKDFQFSILRAQRLAMEVVVMLIIFISLLNRYLCVFYWENSNYSPTNQKQWNFSGIESPKGNF